MSTTEIDPLSFKEPAGLRPLLSGYVTEVLRFQPENIVLFSKDYFTAMSNGQLQEFLAYQVRPLALAHSGLASCQH